MNDKFITLFGKQVFASTTDHEESDDSDHAVEAAANNVDTSLRLSAAVVPKNIDDHEKSYKAPPKKSDNWFQLFCPCTSTSTSSSSNLVVSPKRKAQQKMNDRESDENKRIKKSNKKRREGGENSEPNILSSEFLQIIGPRQVFLYRKKLVDSDVQRSQNRLYVNSKEKLMEFLTEEERRAVDDKENRGIDLIGIDRMGREYNLHSNRWGKVIVFNKDWGKMVVANGAKTGDWVDLWGCRLDGEFCLAVNFSST